MEYKLWEYWIITGNYHSIGLGSLNVSVIIESMIGLEYKILGVDNDLWALVIIIFNYLINSKSIVNVLTEIVEENAERFVD